MTKVLASGRLELPFTELEETGTGAHMKNA